MVNEGLQFYVDTLIVENLMSDPRLSKQAQSGLVTSLIQKVFNYAHEQMQEFKDSDHKIAWLTNFLVPGVLTAFGFPVLGFLSRLAEVFFGMDFAKIFAEAGEAIKNLVVGGKQTNSAAVDSAISKVVINTPLGKPDPSSEEELEQRKQMLASAKMTFRESQLFKIALVDYLEKNPDVNLTDPEINIKFAAGWFSSGLSTFVASRHKTIKILIAVIGWIAKALLAAGGFMVMGDVINSVIGGKSTSPSSEAIPSGAASNEPQTSIDNANQNVFPVNPAYTPESFNTPYARWVIQSDPSSIDHLLLSWTIDIYPSLRGHESEIRGLGTFQSVEQIIKAYNAGGPPNMTFIPRQWKSRKQVVDNFMNEAASKIKPSSSPLAPGTVNPIPNYHPLATPATPGTMV